MNSEILKFAKKAGFDNAELKYVKWKGYTVYEPKYDIKGTAYVGYPSVILVKGSEIRMSNAEESLEILDLLYPDDDAGYKDEFDGKSKEKEAK